MAKKTRIKCGLKRCKGELEKIAEIQKLPTERTVGSPASIEYMSRTFFECCDCKRIYEENKMSLLEHYEGSLIKQELIEMCKTDYWRKEIKKWPKRITGGKN